MKKVPRLRNLAIRAGAAVVLEIGPAPGNIVDRALMRSLGANLRALARDTHLKAVVLRGSGAHFSYGASVQEHLPEEVAPMLAEFHALLRLFDEVSLPPVIAAVRGRCLGGGFELALACDRIVVEEGAQLGCPEVRLGVFPPAGAALLPLRVHAGRAAELLVSGRLLDGREALEWGVADLLAPAGGLDAAVEELVERTLQPLSAAALRQARRACRHPWREALGERLAALEKQYLEEVMATHDALEGLGAFLDKRQPAWSDR